MSDRYTRRQLKRQLGPEIMQHPCVKRMKRNVREAGKLATEVYTLPGSTHDLTRYFDVYSMRKWANANVPICGTWLDWRRVEHLIETNAVDPSWIQQQPLEKMLEPVIIGVSAHECGRDEVLDGQHRYVAIAMAAVQFGMFGKTVPMMARFLEPDQWRRFQIPNFIATALHFDDSHASDAHKWPTAA